MNWPGNPSHHAAIDSPNQKCIDEQISDLQDPERIRQLKEQRNALSPISTLPPEILGTIFFFVLVERFQVRVSQVFPFYYFTHVSRSWRSIALDTPQLWQVVILSRTLNRWATLVLERSKAADLSIISNLSQSSTPSGLVSFLKKVFTRHTARVRELDLTLGRYNASSLAIIFDGLKQSSLLLHSLQLNFRAARVEHYPTFPTGLMETESLRSLEVGHCDGPWFSLSPRALTNLKLYNIPNPPPLPRFLEFLRGLATLQVLDMEDSLPLASDPNCGLVKPVDLPDLHHLRLASTKNYKEVTHILSRIIVPPSATLRFVMKNTITFDELAPSFSTFFSHMERAGGDLSYSDLHVLSEGSGHIRLQAWKDGGNISTDATAPDLDVIVAATTHPILSPGQEMVQNIFHSLPLSNITTLILDISPVGTLLKVTFGHLPLLQNVNVIGKCTFDLIEALTRKATNRDIQLSDHHSIMFPALKFLWIQNALFENGVQDLQDCLTERYQWTAELLKLKLTDCSGLCRSDVANLRKIIVDLEWDGSYVDNSKVRTASSDANNCRSTCTVL